MSTTTTTNRIALVFGASGEQGRAVVEGLVDRTSRNGNTGYDKVYAFTRETKDVYLTDGLGATLYTGNIENMEHVMKALKDTRAQHIFVVTTTELSSANSTTVGGGDNRISTGGASDAAEAEFQVLVELFHMLKLVYEQDKLPRHIVLSVRDNVQQLNRQILERTGQLWIEPLDDGSIVPHYTAKGRGGEYGLKYLSGIPELRLTLITMPFLYSNFLGFFAPLPNEGKTQWSLTACFGDGKSKIDMMGSSDLAYIVPNIFGNPTKYDNQNLRLVGQQISMDEIAAAFSDLFGKDVIYNPLTVQEVSTLSFSTAPAMAQMCQFVGGHPHVPKHDLKTTLEVAFPKQPQTFEDWLLTHSDSTVFKRVGLDFDAPEILSVTVFGGTGPEGTSVVKGLLNDTRKRYTIRATTRHVDSEKAKAVHSLDPDRVQLVYADIDDPDSCKMAVDGVDGAFLVTDFYSDEVGQDMEAEERHAKNVIDACEASQSVKHLVFSTMESVDEMNKILGLGLEPVKDVKGKEGTVVQFDAKARAAAYARTKRLSVTYVLMPCYAEMFFDRIEKRVDDTTGKERFVLTLPLKDDTKVMCMSVDDLGPAVANIFDSYQVYAGHEIGLVTDFVTAKEVRDIIEEVFLQEENKDSAKQVVLETEEIQSEDWVQAKDTYMKDLGQMFAYMSHSDAVKMRHSVAKTLKLVPSARPLRQWVEQNVDNAAFREKLGLR